MSFAYKYKEKYNYRDYLTWNREERWELIDGSAFNMSPAPAPEQQEISGNIFFEIKKFLLNKSCRVYSAPFDVRFCLNPPASDEQIDTVLQPDISVICDISKIDTKGCAGSPDLIVEILSPYSADRDLRDKFLIYQKYGVREYWIADPANKTLSQYVLREEGGFSPVVIHFMGDLIECAVLQGLTIMVDDIFIR